MLIQRDRARVALNNYSLFFAQKYIKLEVLDYNHPEFLLKQLNYSPSISIRDSQLAWALLAI